MAEASTHDEINSIKLNSIPSRPLLSSNSNSLGSTDSISNSSILTRSKDSTINTSSEALPAIPDSLLEALSREPPPLRISPPPPLTTQPLLSRSSSSGRTGILGFRKASILPTVSTPSSTSSNQPPSPGLSPSSFAIQQSLSSDSLTSDSLTSDSNNYKPNSSNSQNTRRTSNLGPLESLKMFNSSSNGKSRSNLPLSSSSEFGTINENINDSSFASLSNGIRSNSAEKRGLWKNAGSAWSRFNSTTTPTSASASNSRSNSPIPSGSSSPITFSSLNKSRSSLTGIRSTSSSHDRGMNSSTLGRESSSSSSSTSAHSSGAARREAGRGIDADLDAMDQEDRLTGSTIATRERIKISTRSSSSRSGGGGGGGTESPWSNHSRTSIHQYTHDLADGNLSDEEDPVDSEDVDEEIANLEASKISLDNTPTTSNSTLYPSLATSIPPLLNSDSLYSRRRQEILTSPPKVFVPLLSQSKSSNSNSPSSPSSPSFNGPRTAPPLLNSTLNQSHHSSHGPTAVEMLRNRSWSDGNVAMKGGKGGGLDEEKIANSLGMGGSLGRGREGGENESGMLVNTSVRSTTADFVVAVVGPRNVGKSTVIRRGLKRPVEAPVIVAEDDKENRVTTCTSVFSIGGQNRTIEVLEIDMALLKYNSEGVIWPPGLPLCEGAMLCYDATDPRALDSLSLLLQAFWTRGSDVPLIVLACKSNPDENVNATDPAQVSQICSVYGAGIVVLDGGANDPKKKMRDSFNWMIRAIMLNRGEIGRPDSSGKSTSFDSVRGESSLVDDQGQTPATSVDNISDLAKTSTSTSTPTSISSPLHSPRTIPKPDIPDGVQNEEGVEYLRGENEVINSVPSLPPPPQLKNDLSKNKSPALDLHFSREDMIDKFLFAAVTGNDEQYVTLFLIVYRRFARPFDVLSKLVERFDFVWGRLQSDPLLSRFAQMKLCGVLSTWFQVYPGDFTAPSTFVILKNFLSGLLPRGATWVAHYSIELLPLLSNIINLEDPEGSWALPDKTSTIESPSFDSSISPARRPSLAPSYDSVSSHHLPLEGNQSRLSVPEPPTPTDSTTSNQSSQYRRGSVADTVRSELSETLSVPSPSNGFGGSRKMSRSVGPMTPNSSLLELSNALTELPADSIATQITRLAWESFSEMTPRDLVRHVLSSRSSKNSSSTSQPVESNIMRSINFVNYLADWVSSMILIQPKTKYRAKVLEQCIAIASYLREQENFDSLMGVLAGLNSQPIFRLVETMETTHLQMNRDRSRMTLEERERSKIPKKLRSLNKLMATTKSFAAYRLALATSGVTMIPYIGVHLQDITVINEIKTDMRDGKVNWSKFSQMGRSAAIVLDCSRVAPALEVDKGIEKCILNVPLIDTERQYELSYMYEPRKSESSTLSRRGLRQVVGNLTSNIKKTI